MSSCVGRNVGVTRHERQLGIELPGEQEIALSALAAGEQIEREIRIAAQAVAGLVTGAPGDELRHHVDAPFDDIAQRLRVVGRDVVSLRGGNAQPRAGLEEELVDLDIGREPVGALGDGVSELGIAGEQARG